MNALQLALRAMGGVALGAFFYAGLWLTVRSFAASRHPVLLTIASFWIRTIIVLAGFFLLMNRNLEYAMACGAGFLLGRIVVSSFVRVPETRVRCP